MSDHQAQRAAAIRKGYLVNTLLSLMGVAGLFLFLFVGWPNISHRGENVTTVGGAGYQFAVFQPMSTEEVIFNKVLPNVHTGTIYREDRDWERLVDLETRKQNEQKNQTRDAGSMIEFGIPVPARSGEAPSFEEGERAVKGEELQAFTKEFFFTCGFSTNSALPPPPETMHWTDNKAPTEPIPHWRSDFPDQFAQPIAFQTFLDSLKPNMPSPEGFVKEEKIRIRVLVDEKGNYRGHGLMSATFFEFEELIREEIPKLKYQPAMNAGKPVKSWVRIVLNLKPHPFYRSPICGN